MKPVTRPLLALAAALAGCSTLKVNTQYDPAAPYKDYKTYAWLDKAPGAEQAPPMRNPAVRRMVVDALDREMGKKGLVRTTPDRNPDFLVSVLGWSQSRVEVTNYGYAYGASYAYSPYGAVAVAVPATSIDTYTDGTLLVDFVDPKTMKMFWRGIATDTISSVEAVNGTINEAARKLLEAYPPKAK